MTRTIRSLAAACLLAAIAGKAGLSQPATPTPALRVDVTRIELIDAGLETVEVDIHVEAEAQRAATVRSFSFQGLRVNGMPAYIPSVSTPVELPAHSRVPVGPFRATFFLRDIGSLSPMRDLLEKARVRLEGTARTEIDLEWIEKLALWSRRGVVWHSFDHEVAVEIPGGTMRELSARAFFTLAEPIVQAGLELRRARDQWLDRTWRQSIERVAAVRSTYLYRKQGEGEPVRVETLVTGVLVSPQRILVPLEAIEPWRFDPAMAFALVRGKLEVVGGGDVELLLPAAGAGTTRTLRASQSEIEVKVAPCETERLLLTDARGKTRKVKVCKASGERALAAIAITAPLGLRLGLTVGSAPAPKELLELTAMRLIGAPDSKARAWEIVRLRGARVDDEIRLDEPIDRSVVGSPLFFDGSPVAIVQHEYGGSLLAPQVGRSVELR